MPEHLKLEQMKGYRDRTLSLGDTLSVDSHLAGCPQCRGELSGLAAVTASAAILTGVNQAAYQHLSYEQMDDWVEDRLDQPDRELVMAHIGICSECARQLIAYQEYAPVMSAPVRTAPLAAPSFAGRLREFFRQPQMALGAAALIALVILAPWNNKSSPGLELTSGMVAPGSVATESTIRDANPSQRGQFIDLALTTAELDVLPDSLRPGAKQIVANPDRSERPASLKGLAPNADAIIQFPAAEVVEERQPVLRWKAFGSAYDVSIYDSRHRMIARRGRLSDTHWLAPGALERGMTYTWEVESAGQKHSGTFRVLGAQEQQQLEQVRAQHGTSHLVLGAASEQLGLLSLAKQEFRALAKEKPGSQQAAKLLNSVMSMSGK